MQILQTHSNSQNKQTGLNQRPSLLKCQIWRSLDFTIGQNSPHRRDKRKDSASRFNDDVYRKGYKDVHHRTVETDQAAVNRYLESHHSGPLDDDLRAALFDALESEGRYAGCEKLVNAAAIAGSSPMGLSAPTISHRKTKRKRRGQRGISSRAKKMVRSCATVLEETYGQKRLVFLTLTLPDAMTDEEFKTVCLSWSDLIRQFWQQLERLLERKQLPKAHVFVNEIQEKRFRSSGRVGLHCHGLYVGRHAGEQWAISYKTVNQLWARLLTNCIGRDIDCSKATEVDSLRKSCKAELGKYISKGCKIVNAIIESGQGDLLPTAWYGASKSLKAEVKAGMRVYTDGFADWIDKNRWLLRQKGILSYTDVFIDMSYRDDYGNLQVKKDVRIGIAGRFTSEATLSRALKWFDSGGLIDLIAA